MIERMEDLILAGMGIPLTPWTIVHGDKLVPLLDRIRENLPEEMRQAQMVIERRDELLAESQRKANQMLQDAKEQAEAMLSESELLRAVHGEAERIRQQVMTELETLRKKTFEEAEAMKAQAYEESRLVREGADRYAETVLSSLDKSLNEFQQVVRNGQKHLKRSRTEALQAASGHYPPNRTYPASMSAQAYSGATPSQQLRGQDGLRPSSKLEV